MKINGNTYLNIVPLGAFRIVHPPPRTHSDLPTKAAWFVAYA